MNQAGPDFPGYATNRDRGGVGVGWFAAFLAELPEVTANGKKPSEFSWAELLQMS